MEAPRFIVHAAGSLGNRPDPGKKAYRLHARFEIGAYPSKRQLEKAMHYWMDRFIADMAKRGYQYLDRYQSTGRAASIGKGREVRGKRKDGTVLPLHLSVGERFIDGERIRPGAGAEQAAARTERQGDAATGHAGEAVQSRRANGRADGPALHSDGHVAVRPFSRLYA